MESENESKFINEYTRSLLVRWADVCAQAGCLPPEDFREDSSNIYVQHAFKRGWITKREPRRLTENGWGAAAAFLKR